MTAALVFRKALTLHIEVIKVKDKVIPVLNYLTTAPRSCMQEWMYRSMFS
jgi:hypothetical protein